MRHALRLAWLRHRCRRGDLCDAACRYVAAWSERVELPFDHTRWVVIDVESTGLDPHRDTPLTIAGLAVVGDEIDAGDSFECAVAAEVPFRQESVAIHGLRPADLVSGLRPHDAARAFIDWVGTSVVVAHHARFDAVLMDTFVRNTLGIHLLNDVVCTARLAERLELGPSHDASEVRPADYTFDSVCARWGLGEVHHRHTAAGDAFAAALLFQRLLARAQKKKIRTVGDIKTFSLTHI